MGLSGQQRRQLQSALIDAFPTLASLEQMLVFGLDKNLRAIAGEGSLQDIVFKLIQIANAQGWVEDLIRAGRASNPGNQQLRILAEELPNSATETPPSILQEQIVQSQDKTNNQLLFDVFLAHNSADKLSVRVINALNKLDFQEESFVKLNQLLKSRQWKEADQETGRLLLQFTDVKEQDRLNIETLETIPCSILQKIDQFWLKYSNRKFGFSIQSTIWQQEFGGKIDGEIERYLALANCFGWRKSNQWKDYNELTFDLEGACRGHLPCFFLSPLCDRYDPFLLSLLNKFVNCTS